MPAAAQTCQVPACYKMFHPIPNDGAAIPANAPAVGMAPILFSEASPDGGTISTLGDVKQVTLRDGGTTMPQVVDGVYLFTRGANDPIKKITWDTKMGCADGALYTLGPMAALPTTSAQIAVAGLSAQGQSSIGCLTGQGPIRFVALEIKMDAAMVPWVPLTRWTLEIDGQPYATSRYGGVQELQIPPAKPGFSKGVDGFAVRCGPEGQGLGYLEPGTHQVRLLGLIAGVAAPVASNTLSVEVDCNGVPMPAPDAGTPPVMMKQGCSTTGSALSLLALAFLIAGRGRARAASSLHR